MWEMSSGRWGAALAALAVSGFWATAARADLVVCNASQTQIRVASVDFDGDGKPLGVRGDGLLSPHQCREVSVPGGGQRLHYIYSSEPGYTGPTRDFCLLDEDAFYHELDKPCDGPGAGLAAFREVQIPEGQDWLLLNLDGAGGYLPVPALPAVDASSAFQPVSAAAPGGAVYASGLTPGDYGPEFGLDGTWQSCSIRELQYVCRFYGEMTRFEIPDGEAYDPGFLPSLTHLPMGARVRVIGDVLQDGDYVVQVAVSRIEVLTDDPFAGVLEALQGTWRVEDDATDRIQIIGSELYAFYDDVVEEAWLQLDEVCPGNDQDGPGLTVVWMAEKMELCTYLRELTDTRLVLEAPGSLVSYVRE